MFLVKKALLKNTKFSVLDLENNLIGKLVEDQKFSLVKFSHCILFIWLANFFDKLKWPLPQKYIVNVASKYLF